MDDEHEIDRTLPVPASLAPDVSIVVLLNHDVAQARRCLGSLGPGAQGIACETILVINGADPAITRFVEAETEGARVIAHPVDAGTAACWNLAFASARAPRALIVHEDAVLGPGSIAELAAAMDANRAIGAAAALHTDERGNVVNGGGIWWRDRNWTRVTPANFPELSDLVEPYPVDGIGSAVSLWDQRLWQEFGGFDERRFPAVGVDADASTAVWSRGRACVVVPAAHAIHIGGAMDSLPGPLTGARLRWFLIEEYESFASDKWSRLDEWYLEPGEPGDEWRSGRPAVTLGLQNARVRAKARAEIADPPVAEHPITNPDRLPEWPTTLDDTAAARIETARAEAAKRYLAWLISDEAKLRAYAEDLEHVVDKQERALASMSATLAQERAMLDGIRSGRVWRTRNAVRRLLRLGT